MSSTQEKRARAGVALDGKRGRWIGLVVVVVLAAAGVALAAALYVSAREQTQLCQASNESRETLRAILVLARESRPPNRRTPAGRAFYRQALEKVAPISC